MSININDFVKTVNKQYGIGSIIRLTDKPQVKYGENVIPSGSLSLDAATGIGGYPRGRIIEVLGNAMSGKTTMALHAIAEANKMGMNALFVDAEHSLDVQYAQAIGVDLDKVFICAPDFGEQALSIVDDVINAQAVGIIVVDSVAALVPKRELDGEVGDSHVGLLARMLSQTCRKISGALARTNTTILFINQYRMTIATTGFGGSPKAPSGGLALGYFSSMIIDAVKIQSLKTGEENTGNRTRVTIKKNKLAAPYKTAEFTIDFGVGINKMDEIVDLAEMIGAIKKSGSWYKVGDESVAQGKPKMINYLYEHPELTSKIMDDIKAQYTNIVPDITDSPNLDAEE